MSRITKDLAERTALKLTEKKLLAINMVKEELSKLLFDYQYESLPEQIKDCFKAHPDYFNKSSSFRPLGEGLNFSYHNIISELPYSKNANVVLNKEQANRVSKLIAKKETMSQKYRQLNIEIESTLFALRTYKNVEREFPEAFVLLPELSTNTSVMINVSSIRSQLQSS